MNKKKAQKIACKGDFWNETVPMFERFNRAPKKLMKGKGRFKGINEFCK